MTPVRLWLAAVTAALALASPALASGDFGCAPSLRLVQGELSGCDDMAILGPANDTRTNLLLLTFDRRGVPGGARPAAAYAHTSWDDLAALFSPPADPAAQAAFAEGEGSRCRTDAEGARRFEEVAAAAKDLPAQERARLVAARRGLKPTCMGPSPGQAAVAEAAAGVRSSAGRAFAAYLRGASAFYEGDFDAAAAAFGALAAAPSPWLQDAGPYMLARTEVNRLQVGAFDQYGSLLGPEHVDRKAAERAEARLVGYVRAHPRGAYVGSAQGLLRRVFWLSGQRDRLAAAYTALLGGPRASAGPDDADLANEIDDKLLGGLKAAETGDPTLLAVLDLRAMRATGGPGDKAAPPLTAAALEAQRPAFARAPELFAYLQAVHAFYVEHSPARVIQLLPDATSARGGGYLWFSRQTLRGMALEAVRDRNARGFWLQLLPGATAPLQRPAVELALAMHDERAGALARVFEAGSPVRTPAFRRVLLTHVADAPLLRRDADDPAAPEHERAVARFTLLWKELSRGRYADFTTDVAHVPAGSPVPEGAYEPTDDAPPALGIFIKRAPGELDCPAPPAIAAALATSPRALRPRLCLAEFVRERGLDGFGLDTSPPKTDLGGTPSLFPGGPYSRLEVYRAVIADRAAPAADKAYALYRAVNCYAPSRSNQCGGAEAEPAQRKAWYTQLKRDHASSRWAQELRYWW